MAESKPIGRPTIYTPELVDKILDVVATHQCGLKKCCALYDWMPNHDTIISWRAKYQEFSDRYLEARKKQAHLLAERTNELAEELTDYIYEDAKSGATCIDSGIVAMQKLIINSKTWLASRIEPKMYGSDKRVEELTGENERVKAELAELRRQLDEKNRKEY